MASKLEEWAKECVFLYCFLFFSLLIGMFCAQIRAFRFKLMNRNLGSENIIVVIELKVSGCLAAMKKALAAVS